jgi:molybdopterin-guanine dinucleotide biosynthesis protein A
VSTAGIVLCGGLSSRMGRDKAWLPWCGRPLVDHVVESLRQNVDEVVVVASAELDLPPLDALVVRDREPELGPMGGIREGLAHVSAKFAFVTGTDVPFLAPAFVKGLLAYECAAAVELDGIVQNLCAVYPRAALPAAEALIAEGRLRSLHLLEEMGYRRVPADAIPDAESVRGFNTPGEYLLAVRRVDPQATATLEFLGRARLALGRRELEVPVGTLAEVLAHTRPALDLVDGARVARPYLVSLGGRTFVRDVTIPIGPDEQVIVLDASVGG